MKYNLAIVSSGDPEKDRIELNRAELHQSRLDANVCCNGCGEMVYDDPHNRHCPVCSFAAFSSKPLTKGTA